MKIEMKKIPFIVVLGLVLTQATFANNKPKKHHRGGIDSSNVLIHLTNCSVGSDGTIKNKTGEVVGKLTSTGTIVDPTSGQVIGSREETTEEKISKIYISN